MLNWMIANLPSILVGLIVFVILTLIVIKLIRDKIAGKSSCASCSGSCNACQGCQDRH